MVAAVIGSTDLPTLGALRGEAPPTDEWFPVPKGSFACVRPGTSASIASDLTTIGGMPATPRIEFRSARFSARNLPTSASSERVYLVVTIRFQSFRMDTVSSFSWRNRAN